jgi:hypothetical protein
MVLLRKGLVKIDASGAAFAPLDGHRDIDASPGTALMDSLFEGVFQVAQWPGKSAGDFEKTMVNGSHFRRY